jgi:hypothetical protein
VAQALKSRYATLKQLEVSNKWMAIRDAYLGIPAPREVFLAGVNDVIAVIEQPASGNGYEAFAQAQREDKPELRGMGHAEQAKAIARLWKQLDLSRNGGTR